MPQARVALLHLHAAVAEPERALDLLHEALRVQAAHNMALGCIDTLEALAEVAGRRGAVKTAQTLLGAAARAREEIGYAARSTLAGLPAPGADGISAHSGSAAPPEVREGLQEPGGQQGGLPGPEHGGEWGRAVAGGSAGDADPDLAAAVERGRSMDLAAAIEWAARSRGPRRRPEFGWAALTPTERSVVELTVRGLSNPEIAARLFIGRGTVKTHLAHVYAKLQVANRTELTRLAAEQG